MFIQPYAGRLRILLFNLTLDDTETIRSKSSFFMKFTALSELILSNLKILTLFFLKYKLKKQSLYYL